MKRLIALFTLASMLIIANLSLYGQEAKTDKQTTTTEEVATTNDAATTAAVEEDVPTPPAEEKSLHQQLKIKIIEGGPMFMGFIILVFVLGLAIAFERIIYLSLATTNTDKLLKRVEEALNSGGIEAAKDVCRNTRGPVASIFYQGLDRYHTGIDIVEKSIVSYGSVQMGHLENGLTWISLFIALSPMLGFLGTVVGMIAAFDAIEAAGDISPSLVAGGIKIALITTVGGLIAAMILQIFYNYILGKIDSIVNSMEDASISLIDILVDYERKNK